MNILITNDDGIGAPGLEFLVKWAQKRGKVTISAPKVEQSGKSHSIELHNAIEVRKVDRPDGIDCYAVDSSPADCVRFAADRLGTHFDLVLSGINRGYNLGRDISYSGTCGAAFEANLWGLRAIALSGHVGTLAITEEQLERVFAYFEEKKLFDCHSLYNVNIPSKDKGIRLTRQGGSFYENMFVPTGNDHYIQKAAKHSADMSDLTIDICAVNSGYISISPLTACRTDWQAYDELTGACARQRT